jgi:hypothetical protein
MTRTGSALTSAIRRRDTLREFGRAAAALTTGGLLLPLLSDSGALAQTDDQQQAPAGSAAPGQAVPAELSAVFVDFNATIRRGDRAGTSFVGVLRLSIATSGAIDDGQLLLDDESSLPVVGQVVGRAVSLVIGLADGTTLYGTGVSLLPLSAGALGAPLGGTFVSSVEGEGGDWAGVSGDSILIGNTIYFPSMAQQVVYQAPLGGGTTVFAGALNTPGNVDGPRRTTARFNGPQGIDKSGGGAALWLADTNNQAVRKITLATNAVSTVLNRSQAIAVVPTISVWGVAGVAVDNSNNVFVSDQVNSVIWYYNASNANLRVLAGKPGVAGKVDGLGSAALFNRPHSISLSDDQALLNVVDEGNMLIRQVGRDGRVVTLGGV